ncbi:response regulator [Flaviaesturariibacter amylovorans]|uniref:Response regulator n=1 Tax=Flaviaesturariibacter amylovorans TaxID=1084520 RepID=A0ABP8HP53_9BACT
MKTYRIILVENDEDEQFFMREAFEASGRFEVLAQASNGDELVTWLREHPGQLPDLILSDLNMPGMNGMELLHALRADARYAALPVVITSTSSTQSIIDRALAAGASWYRVKPETFISYGPFAETLYQELQARLAVG